MKIIINPMDSEIILLTDLAKELKIDRRTFRKFVLKQGIFPNKILINGNPYLTLSRAEADSIRSMRSQNNNYDSITRKGYFYIIQPIPELDVNRVKLGFSNNVANRLSDYKTISPSANVLKSYPCKFSWEQAAIDFCTEGCKRIGVEVFQVNSIKFLISKTDEFFNMMPKILLA